ncbi:MAG: hypothetical protein AAF206_27790 [Bacteroidota bacterium]
MQTSRASERQWMLYVLAGSFLFSALLGWMDFQTTHLSDLLTPSNLLAIMLYTALFALPILGLGMLVNWIGRF